MTIIKWISVLSLWALIGLVVHNQFDPNTVFGSVMGSAFIFIWFGILIIGIFIRQKLKKK
jgi:amino acid permease